MNDSQPGHVPTSEVVPLLDREIVRVRVWGEFACFTNPESKVERVSYPAMTPSAARGILEAVCWKPEFEWYVQRILVLSEIQFTSIRRNEVQDVISATNVKGWMQDPSTFTPYFADSAGREGAHGENRTQRNTVALRDVAYVIEARVLLRQSRDPALLRKYREMLERRVRRGQCHHQPSLGIREYVAHFGPPLADDQPIDDTRDVGLMLFDLDYSEGRNKPLFAPARLEAGVLDAEAMRAHARPLEELEVIAP